MSDESTWRADGVDAIWADRDGPRVRLDVTLRPQAVTSRLALILREVQRSIPGTTRVVVLRVGTSRQPVPTVAPAEATPIEGAPTDAQLADLQRAFDWHSDPAFVSIAVLDGDVTGPGLLLALGSDLRIASSRATLAAVPAPGGLLPSGSQTLVDAVGYPAALDLCLTGRRLSAPEAHARGLLQQVVEPDQLQAEVERLVTALLVPGRDDAREVKALLLNAENRPQENQRGAERGAQLRRFDDSEGSAVDGESRA